MLDLKRIRQDPDAVKAALSRRDSSYARDVDRVLELDEEWREATGAAETTRAKQRARSKNVEAERRTGKNVDRELAELKELSAKAKELTEKARDAQEEMRQKLTPLPNLPDPSAAPGPEDELIRTVGEPPAFEFEPRDHLELAGPAIDMERAARLSGARFAYLLGDLVMVELALVHWVLEKLRGHGFEPVIPPVLVREQALYGTGFLPDTEQQI